GRLFGHLASSSAEGSATTERGRFFHLSVPRELRHYQKKRGPGPQGPEAGVDSGLVPPCRPRASPPQRAGGSPGASPPSCPRPSAAKAMVVPAGPERIVGFF